MSSAPRGHRPRLDRLDRHAGDRRRPAEPRPAADHRPGRRGRGRRPAGRPGADPRRPTVAVARATAAQDLQLAFYAAASQARLGQGRVRAAGDPRRPARGRGARRPAGRRRPQRDHRLHRARARRSSALEAGRTLALANKESLIAGGALGQAAAAARAARPGRLRALGAGPVPARRRRAARSRRLVLTASGGPFRGRRADELADVTVERGARPPDLGHGPGRHDQLGDAGQQGPRGDRGAPALRRPLRRHRRRRAPAVDRPLDGRVRRRLDARPGQPARHAAADRARPGLARPAAATCSRRWTGRRRSTWEFLPLDHDAFPAVALARPAGEAGGVVPALYNAANEEAVAAFLAGRLSFRGIVDTRRAYPRRRAGPRRTDLRRGRAGRGELGPGARPAASSPEADAERDPAHVLGIVAFAIGLLFSIGFHELGHFVCGPAGSACGCRSTWSASAPRSGRPQRGETEYGIKADPARRLHPDRRDDPAGRGGREQARRPACAASSPRSAARRSTTSGPPTSGRVFYAKPWWQRVIVMFAGPFNNLILAVVFFTVVARRLRRPDSTTTLARSRLRAAGRGRDARRRRLQVPIDRRRADLRGGHADCALPRRARR